MSDALPRLEQVIEHWAAVCPDRAAIIYGGRCWIYAAVREEMDRRAALLVVHGLAPGAVAVTSAIASDDLALTMLACARAGLVFFYLPADLAPEERAAFAARAGAVVALTPDGATDAAFPALAPLPLPLPGSPAAPARAEAIRRSADGSADDAFSLFLTSGTTGTTPKLVRQPHRTMTWRHRQPDWWAGADNVVYRPHGTFFQSRPLAECFCYGTTTLLTHPKDPAQMEAEMVACGATMLLTNVPTARLLAEQATPPPPGLKLRIVRTGGMALPDPLRHAAARRYGAAVLEDYASTEGGQMLGTPRGGAPDGSIGVPNPGVRARIVDERGADVPEGETGELIVHSPGLMLGYLDNPEATAATLRDGWLWTGDLARRDADGFYFLVGRRALRINVGGHKVAPEAVEAALAQHPAVREVVVLAAPDRLRGEAVRAVIVPRSTGDPPTVGELRRFCRARLATYQVPRVWEFRNELPRSPLGKVLRQNL